MDWDIEKKSIIDISINEAIEKAKVDLEPYREKIEEMKVEAELLKVENDESWALSVDLGIRAKKLAKEITNKVNQIIAPANEFIRSIKNFGKSFTEILDSIENITKDKNKTYKILQEQRALEAQKKIEEETEKLRQKVIEEAKAAGVPPIEVPTPVLAKTPRSIRTIQGIAYSTEYWKFEPGPIHRNSPDYKNSGSRVIVYFGYDENNFAKIGENIGLEEETLKNFISRLKNVRLELEVDKNGSFSIVSVDGKLFPIIPVEFLMPDSKALRKAIDGGIRHIEGIKIYREDKEVYKT